MSKFSLSNTRYPLRVLLGMIVALIIAIMGGLNLFGINVTVEQIQWVTSILGIVSGIILLVAGEQYVTPVSDPRNNEGVSLVPLSDAVHQ